MPNRTNESQRSLDKEQKKREITALLQEQGPLEPVAIIRAIPGLTLVTANRYLDQLIISGHIRKVRSPGKRRHIRVFGYQNDYGAKMDIVSVALSHPLHRLTLSTAGRVQDHHGACWLGNECHHAT